MLIAFRDQLQRNNLWVALVLAVVAALVGIAAGTAPLIIVCVVVFGGIAAVVTLIDPIYGLGAALLLGPLKPIFDVYIPQVPLDPGQIMIILTIGAWLIQGLRKKEITVPRTKLMLPLLIFIGAVLLSLLNALSFGYAIKEVIKWVQLLLVMLLVIDRGDARRMRVVTGMILASTLVQSLIGLWQFGLRGDGPEHFLILDGRFYRAYGTFEQPNPFGGFLGLGLMVSAGLALVALAGWWDVFTASLKVRPIRFADVIRQSTRGEFWRFAGVIGLMGIIAAGLVASWSRGAWLGAAAGAAAMLFAWPKKAGRGILLLAAAGLAFFVAMRAGILPSAVADRLTGFTDAFQSFDVRGVDISDANYSVVERLAHWQAASEMARYHPWLGVGIGNYEPVYSGYSLLNWPYPLGHAHNIYLNMLAETGLVGLLAYLFLWIAVIWRTWQVTCQSDRWSRLIAVGLLGAWVHLSVHQMVDTLYVANIHLHLGAMLGLLGLLMTQHPAVSKGTE